MSMKLTFSREQDHQVYDQIINDRRGPSEMDNVSELRRHQSMYPVRQEHQIREQQHHDR